MKKDTYVKHTRRQFPVLWVGLSDCQARGNHSNHDNYAHSCKHAFCYICTRLSISAQSIVCTDVVICRQYSHSCCLNWLETHQLLVSVFVCVVYSALAGHHLRHSAPHTTTHWRSVLVTTIKKCHHKVIRVIESIHVGLFNLNSYCIFMKCM